MTTARESHLFDLGFEIRDLTIPTQLACVVYAMES